MKKELRNKKKKGFTLIELIVVIVILGILALIVVPKIGGFTSDAAISSHNANVRTLHSAAMMYVAENTGTAVSTTDDETKLKEFVQEWPKVPKGVVVGGTKYAGTESYDVEIKTDGTVTITPGLATK